MRLDRLANVGGARDHKSSGESLRDGAGCDEIEGDLGCVGHDRLLGLPRLWDQRRERPAGRIHARK